MTMTTFSDYSLTREKREFIEILKKFSNDENVSNEEKTLFEKYLNQAMLISDSPIKNSAKFNCSISLNISSILLVEKYYLFNDMEKNINDLHKIASQLLPIVELLVRSEAF